MNRKALVAVVLIAAALFSYRSAWSQGTETGSINGTVKDPTGAVVPGADVTAKNTATNLETAAKTDNAGEYIIRGLIPGIYDVTVASGSFKTFTARAEVTVGGEVTVDAKLSLSGETAVVEVVGQGGVVVNTQTQELSQIVNSQQVSDLPSLTRNPYDFVAISGNVSSGDNTTSNFNSYQSLTARGVGYSLNGQRESGTEILLDGVENDGVQEYSIITNNFSPEYGRASGGVVNLTSKSGTNDWHGSAWEFNRLSAYTSNTYENNVNDVPRGGYVRNQFGFAVGGPIIKNKLFIFETTEWTRVRSNASVTEEIFDPTFTATLPANAASYFSTYATGAYPSSGTVTAGQLAANGVTVGPINGTIPVPASQPVFDIIHFKAPFDAGGDVPQNTYRLLGRIDYNLNSQTNMFFRAGYESEDEFQGSQAPYSPYPQYDIGYSQTNQSYLYTLNHVFNPNLLNSTKVSFTRFNDFYSFNTALESTPNLYINSGFPADPVTGNLIQMPGVGNQGPGLGGYPEGGPQNTFQLEDDLSWTKGKHAMRFGGQYTYIQLNYAYGAYLQAVEQLSTTGSLQPGFNQLTNTFGNPLGSSLVAFTGRVNPQGALPCVASPAFWNTASPSDLIVTPSCTVTPPLSEADYARSYRYHDWALYAMDSYRLTPKLTVNYGLRYEHFGVQRNNHQDLDSNVYPGPGSGLYEQIASGGVELTTKSSVGAFWGPNWGTLGPRVGFAYDVFGNGTTSVRGGFGISYERNFGNVTYNASFNPPASALVSATCLPGSVSCTAVITNNSLGPLGSPGPPSPLPPSELRMPNPYINTAQTQFWSLDVQRQVMRNTMIDVSYSGAHGVHLYDINNVNLLGSGNFYLGEKPESAACAGEPPPPDPVTGLPVCLVRANNQYTDINRRGSGGISSYNAMNIKFQTNNLHDTGLTLIANYTWAHSLDDLSSTFSDSEQGASTNIGDFGFLNVLHPKLSYGNSDYDIRNRFVLSPIWETPWYKTGRGWERQVLGGWTISGIFTARTGIPFSVFDYDNVVDGYTPPYLTPATPVTYRTGAPVPSGATGVFNVLTVPLPASFAPLDPALGISDFGPYPANMTHRNSFRGPGAWNIDTALLKSFQLTERFNLQFRAEAFDALNHANLYVYQGNLDYTAPTTTPIEVTAYRGGLGSLAINGNHDERRFFQFALKLGF
jgi:hypothetical protein